MMSREDVDALHRRIDELMAETNKLIERRMVSNDAGTDRQMAMYVLVILSLSLSCASLSLLTNNFSVTILTSLWRLLL